MAKPKRPKDPVSRAVLIGRMLVGDAEKDAASEPTAKQSAGAKGGKARAAKLSEKRKREIAKKAAAKRWRHND